MEILPLRTRIYHILRAAMENQGRAVRGITRQTQKPAWPA
jgi:hypothetical protein